ncbi:Aspartate--tRNA(Asp/Asn) ligase [Streptomyces badius]
MDPPRGRHLPRGGLVWRRTEASRRLAVAWGVSRDPQTPIREDWMNDDASVQVPHLRRAPRLYVGTDVRLSGWLHNRRDLGGILFIDLRDHYGITQLVARPGTPGYEALAKLTKESTVRIDGKVVSRGAENVNPELPTGEIEVEVCEVEVLGAAAPLPFTINTEDGVNEERRLEYRFLDLRRERMHRNIMLRSAVIASIRSKMVALGFNEMATPILTATSPEGARDFVVPSRLWRGCVWARTARWPDRSPSSSPRPTSRRSPSASLVPGHAVFFGAGEFDEVSKIMSAVRVEAAKRAGHFEEGVFRFARGIVDFPMYERDEETGKIDFSHNPFSMPQGGLADLEEKDPLDILAWQYDIVCNGIELSSGAIRNHEPELMLKAFEIAGYDRETVEHEFAGMLHCRRLHPYRRGWPGPPDPGHCCRTTSTPGSRSTARASSVSRWKAPSTTSWRSTTTARRASAP